jgi:hypothetical protein
MTQEIKVKKNRGSMRKGMPARPGAGRPPGVVEKSPRKPKSYSIVLPTVPEGAGPAVLSEAVRPFVAKAVATLTRLMDSPNEDIAHAASTHLLDRFAGSVVRVSVSDNKTSTTSTIWGSAGGSAGPVPSIFRATEFRAMVRDLYGLTDDDSSTIDERAQAMLRSGQYTIVPDQIPIGRRDSDAIDIPSTVKD